MSGWMGRERGEGVRGELEAGPEPLALRVEVKPEACSGLRNWIPRSESDRRPHSYQECALPTELRGHVLSARSPAFYRIPRAPATQNPRFQAGSEGIMRPLLLLSASADQPTRSVSCFEL